MFFAFFSISVALAQNTMGVTTTTTMAIADRNGPLAPLMRPCAPCWHSIWMGDNPPSLRMYFWWWFRVCMALKVLLCSGNDASPKHRSFWGPYTPSTAPKIISTCSGGFQPSIQCIGLERKASCGALGGHFRRRRPWSAMVVLVLVDRWRLASVLPPVGIVAIVYGSFFSFLRGSHTWHNPLTERLGVVVK